MISLRLFSVLFMFVALAGIAFAAGVTYTEDNGLLWTYEIIGTDASYLNIDGTPVSFGVTFGPTAEAGYTVNPGFFGRTFLYPQNTEDFVFHTDTVDLGDPSTSSSSFTFQPYKVSGANGYHIKQTASLCNASLGKLHYFEGSGYFTVYLNSSLEPPQNLLSLPYTGTENIDHILDPYYNMKTFVFMNIKSLDSTTINKVYSFEDYDLDLYQYNQSGASPIASFLQLTNLGGLDTAYSDAGILLNAGNKYPVVYLKSDSVQVGMDISHDISNYQFLCDEGDSDYCGNFSAKAYAVPLDGKCDLNLLDGAVLQNTIDFAPASSVPTYFQICPYGQFYNASGSCQAEVEENIHTTFVDYSNLDFATCYIDEQGSVKFEGSIIPGAVADVQIFIGATPVSVVVSNGFFSADLGSPLNLPYVLKDNPDLGRTLAECEVGDFWTYEDETFLIEDDLTEEGHPDEYRYRLEANSTNDFFEIDDNDTLFYRDDFGTVSFDEIDSPINISGVNNTITTLEEGVEVSSKKVDPNAIALHLHKLTTLRNETQAVEKLTEVAETMRDYNVTIDLSVTDYTSCIDGAFWTWDFDGVVPPSDGSFCYTDDELKKRTTVTINLSGQNTTGLVVYQVLPKHVAANIDQIKYISDGGAQRFVQDKDPIIGWYFNDSDGDEELIFEIPGNSSGGEVIITREPILFNEGELVVNYRTMGCAPGEAHLFDLDDLVFSGVHAPGTSTYNVCVAHITDPLFNDITGANQLNVLRFNDGDNASFNLNTTFTNNVVISADNTTWFWEKKVSSSNPPGNYSCIGSVTDEENSVFGDCGFTNKRIWLHLGEDATPPVSNLTYPTISSSLIVNITAVDPSPGTGVYSISYCVDDDNTCDPSTGTTIVGDEVNFPVTCSFETGCIKFVRYYSIDNFGNQEPLQSHGLKMLDEGSACQADCTAAPHPNRYLAECNKLNGCQYYQYDNTSAFDDGLYVSHICDLLVQNAYAKFNETHEIQCPAGPMRKTRFVNERLDVSSVSTDRCEILYANPYNMIVDGQLVTMKIISCID